MTVFVVGFIIALGLVTVIVLLPVMSYIGKATRKKFPLNASTGLPTWVKVLVASMLLLIFIFWGGEILSVMGSWDWSTTSLGKAIDDATSPGWSKLLWLLVLIPLLFFVRFPKDTTKTVTPIFGWVLAVAGVVAVVWFATQDPMRMWHNDNVVKVDLGRVNSDTVPLKPDQTLIIKGRRATVYGQNCTTWFEPERRWREMYGRHEPDLVLLSFVSRNHTTYITVNEPYRSMFQNMGVTVDVLVWNDGC